LADDEHAASPADATRANDFARFERVEAEVFTPRTLITPARRRQVRVQIATSRLFLNGASDLGEQAAPLKKGRRSRTAHTAATPSDAELIGAIACGSSPALGALFDRHHERVERVLRRGGLSFPDIDDVVQLTFLQVSRVATAYDGRESCAAWLCGIAIRLAARQRRSTLRRTRALSAFAAEGRTATAVDPEKVLASREELLVFAGALAKLGRKKREVFVRVELEGEAAEEVGQALGIPAATVRTRLFHARPELRTAMAKALATR
jgi:RNA polymerase sigma-70 factor (ECF subfamily)